MANGANGKLNGQVSMMAVWKTVGTVLGLLVVFGGIIASYYKSQQEQKDEIAALRLELQMQRDEDRLMAQDQHWTILNRLDIMEQNADNESMWLAKAMDDVADAIPDAMEKHLIYDHPKKGGAFSMKETEFEVVISDKPAKIQPAIPELKHPTELELLQKKKSEMAKSAK
jgi:hypothetical protein